MGTSAFKSNFQKFYTYFFTKCVCQGEKKCGRGDILVLAPELGDREACGEGTLDCALCPLWLAERGHTAGLCMANG